jgi:4-amino-4-deoxy-L-arabinose transferase-like glycosyltransferase
MGKHGIHIILGAYILLMLVLNFLSPGLYWDENAYLANARAFAGDSNYVEEFRYPLIGQMIGVLWLVSGESLLVAQLLMISFATLGGYIFYLLCLRIFDVKESLICTGLFLFSVVMIEWGFRVYTGVPGLAFLLAGLYYLRGRDVWRYLVAGVFFGLSFMMRYTYLVLLGVVGLFLIYRLAKERKLARLNEGLAVLIGAVAVVSPWLIYDKIMHKTFFWTIIQQYNIGYVQTAQPIYLQLLNLLWVLGPLCIAFFVGGFYVIKERKEILYIALFSVVVHGCYIVFSTPVKEQRYVTPLVPFAVVVGVYGVRRLAESFKKKTGKTVYRVGAGILILYAFIAGGLHVAFLIGDGICKADGSIMQSIEFLEENAAADDVVVSNVWPYFGYGNNLEVQSMWTAKPEKYKTKYHARYVLVHETQGEPYDEKALMSVKGVQRVQEFSGCDGTVNVYEFS